MRPDDEGGVRIGIAHDHEHGTVVINFGTQVAWIGLYPDQAMELAKQLVKHATAAKFDRKKKK